MGDTQLFAGVALVAISLIGLTWPSAGMRTNEQRDSRLKELDEGVSEAYFEERRELEVFPSYFVSRKTARLLALVPLVVGCAQIWLALSK